MIVPIRSSATDEFEGVLALAHRLFPPETREPDETWRAEADGASRVPYRYLVWKEDEAVAGFVRFASLLMGVGFVIHLGVLAEHRGRGIGGALLRLAREAGEPDRAVWLAEVEVGDPLQWWRRQGAETVTDSYAQPALRPETAPVPLNLVALGPWRTVPGLVERFCAEVWGLGADDPLVRRAVAA